MHINHRRKNPPPYVSTSDPYDIWHLAWERRYKAVKNAKRRVSDRTLMARQDFDALPLRYRKRIPPEYFW